MKVFTVKFRYDASGRIDEQTWSALDMFDAINETGAWAKEPITIVSIINETKREGSTP